MLPGAIENTAYYVGPLEAAQPNISQKAIWDMRNYVPNTKQPNKEGTGKVAFQSDGTRTKDKIAKMFDA
jgi:hypothetical protein